MPMFCTPSLDIMPTHTWNHSATTPSLLAQASHLMVLGSNINGPEQQSASTRKLLRAKGLLQRLLPVVADICKFLHSSEGTNFLGLCSAEERNASICEQTFVEICYHPGSRFQVLRLRSVAAAPLEERF